jgi:hypothetical protein
VWLSRIPALIPDHFISFRSMDPVRSVFARQAADDWRAFLALRSSELLAGGRLVVLLPALADDGTYGFQGIMDHANAVLAEMVDEGVIAAHERARMALGAHPRRKSDLLEPFAQDGLFQQLTVERLDVSVVTDIAWTEFERDGDRDALASKHSLFFRAVFMPSLAGALDRVRAGDAQALVAFGDRLEQGLTRRLASQPAAMHSLVQTIVLAKHGN